MTNEELLDAVDASLAEVQRECMDNLDCNHPGEDDCSDIDDCIGCTLTEITVEGRSRLATLRARVAALEAVRDAAMDEYRGWNVKQWLRVEEVDRMAYCDETGISRGLLDALADEEEARG